MQRRLTSANIREIVHVSNISLNYALYTGAKKHFADVSKMVELVSGTEREVDDAVLTGYTC